MKISYWFAVAAVVAALSANTSSSFSELGAVNFTVSAFAFIVMGIIISIIEGKYEK